MLWWAFPTLLIQYSLPLPLPSPARTGPRPERGVGVSRQQAPVLLNLLQEVGGKQPHLAAGVDLDVTTSFISFLHYDLVLLESDLSNLAVPHKRSGHAVHTFSSPHPNDEVWREESDFLSDFPLEKEGSGYAGDLRF